MKNVVRNYEIQAWLKLPLFYLFNLGFFMFSIASMLGTGGYFDDPTPSTTKVSVLNSPYYLCSTSFLFTKFLLFGTAVYGSFGLYKDYRHKAHAFIYSFPIKKALYLNGKLGSALFAIISIGTLTFLGIWIGELILGLENPKIIPNSALGYMVALGIYLLPTLVTVGLFVFVAVGSTRNYFTGFVVILCFALLQVLLEQLFFELPNVLAILDPFGQNAFHRATQDWGFNVKNGTDIPLDAYVIANRLLWLVLGILAYLLFYKRFEFSYTLRPMFNWMQRKAKPATRHSVKKKSNEEVAVQYHFSRTPNFRLFLKLMGHDFKSIVKSWLFLIPCILGAIVVFFIQLKVSRTGEFNFLPLTRLFIGAPLTLYTLIVTLTTFLFSGLLMHRARQHKMKALIDSTPVSSIQLIASKIGAIGLMQVVQLVLFAMVSITIQAINGYYHFELGLYAFHLFVLLFPILFIWNITSQFVHNLIPNLFIGLFALLALWLSAQAMASVGIQTNLLKFNYLPNLEYSDFYGYGHQLKGYLLLLAYWLSFVLILTVLLFVFWHRGSLVSIKESYRLAKSRVQTPLGIVFIVLLVHCGWIGTKIFIAETMDNNAQAVIKSDQWLDNYKKEWGVYDMLAQPKVTDITLDITINPNKASFSARGNYTLVNHSDEVIDTLFVRTGFDENTNLDWGKKAKLIKRDNTMKTYLFKLNPPMHPKDSIYCSFTVTNTPNSTFTRNSNVLSSGTYIRQDILPRLGYQFLDHELSLSDSLVHRFNYFHRDANYVNINTTIRTEADQLAYAPGELVSKQIGEKHAIYSFRTTKAIKFNFSFHSARFERFQEKHGKINLEVLYNKGHQQNIKLMLAGLKTALDYNTKLFGDYPFEEIRILEYPFTEGNYTATLTSNNIPTSEILFNINMEAMDGKIYLPFYVMAHEITHQWFGNKMIPADAEGAKMLTESITEYITLLIYEAYFGAEMAQKFLEVQEKRYQRGLTSETGEERPLYKVLSHQEYIAYGKGAIAFAHISEAIGKEKLLRILQAFVKKFQYSTTYFPTSEDLLRLFEQELEEEDQQLVAQWLTKMDGL